jgi:hypothetical protein
MNAKDREGIGRYCILRKCHNFFGKLRSTAKVRHRKEETNKNKE